VQLEGQGDFVLMGVNLNNFKELLKWLKKLSFLKCIFFVEMYKIWTVHKYIIVNTYKDGFKSQAEMLFY
jgi:hypothetical protein